METKTEVILSTGNAGTASQPLIKTLRDQVTSSAKNEPYFKKYSHGQIKKHRICGIIGLCMVLVLVVNVIIGEIYSYEYKGTDYYHQTSTITVTYLWRECTVTHSKATDAIVNSGSFKKKCNNGSENACQFIHAGEVWIVCLLLSTVPVMIACLAILKRNYDTATMDANNNSNSSGCCQQCLRYLLSNKIPVRHSKYLLAFAGLLCLLAWIPINVQCRTKQICLVTNFVQDADSPNGSPSANGWIALIAAFVFWGMSAGLYVVNRYSEYSAMLDTVDGDESFPPEYTGQSIDVNDNRLRPSASEEANA